MKKLRFAMIGIGHVHAAGMIKDFLNQGEDRVEFLGFADYPYRSPEESEHLKMNRFQNEDGTYVYPYFENYRDILAQKPDLVLLCADICAHAPLAEETLSLGIHTLIEKPMALTMADAKRMYRAAKTGGAELIVNWPVAWFAGFRKAKELADAGKVGEILRVQYRSPSTRGPYPLNAYSPEELSKTWWYQRDKGGGSICDYAGYGCVLATWITGKTAKRVFGIKRNYFLPFSDVEDYSLFTIDFGRQVGMIEGSWSTMSNGEIPTGPVIYGEKGVIVADRFSNEVRVYTDFLPYHPIPPANEVHRPAPLTDSLAVNVSRFILEGEPLFDMITSAFNMKAMAAFDAGRRSCESGAFEEAEDPFAL